MESHYRAAVRVYLKASIYAEDGEQLVTATVIEAATTMSDPADLINRAIEALSKAAIDLPAFSTLERLASHLRAQVHTQMYEQAASRLTAIDVAALDALLTVQTGAVTTAFNRLKQTPGPARSDAGSGTRVSATRITAPIRRRRSGSGPPITVITGAAGEPRTPSIPTATAWRSVGATASGRRHVLQRWTRQRRFRP